MAFQAYSRGILRSPSFTTSGSAPIIANSPSSGKEQSSGNLYYQPYPPIPWRLAKPYCETGEISLRNRQREKPLRPPLPSSVFRAASAENRQNLNTWTPPSGNAIPVPGALDDPQSSEISLCSSFGNIPDYSVSAGQDQPVDITMHYGQPHAYALYDFDTKVEGDLQFRVGDILILEEAVDDAWYRGHSVRTGQVGIFPMNHVEVRIPLSTGLYTKDQPKPRIRTISDTKNVQQKTQTSQPDELMKNILDEHHQQTNGQSHLSHELSSVPRRPSRVRVSSLRSKYDTSNVSSDEAVHFNTNTTNVLRKPGLRRSQTQYQPLSSMYRTDSVMSPTEPKNLAHLEKTDLNRSNLSSVPSIVSTTRPRSQTSVYHLAQNLEQRGITLSRMKSMPPGGRAIFPSSVAQKACASTPIGQSKTVSKVTSSENAGKMMNYPSNYMVPTPLALIAREQNRILGKGKLAPTEAYPSATSSDPQLDKFSKTEAKGHNSSTSTNGSVVVSTVSEIDLSHKPSKRPGRFGDPVLPAAQPLGPNKLAPLMYNNMFNTHQQPVTTTHKESSNNTHVSEKNNLQSTYQSKPCFYSQTMYQNSPPKLDEIEIPSALKSREDTLVHEDKPSQEEEQHIVYSDMSVAQSTNSNNFETRRQSELQPQKQNTFVESTEMHLPTTKAKPRPESPTYVTKMAQDLSIDERPKISHSQSSVNQAVPEIPKSVNSLKIPSGLPNLDKQQTDNFKEAIFSSLKKNKLPEHWLYVLYDYVGTETGDLTVQSGSTIRCLDPLPPPADSSDVNIPERWLRCATWYGQVGQVPSTFVRRILDPEELDRLLQHRPRAQAMYDFNSEAKDDLQLKAGDIIYLFEAVDANWYRGESASNGKQGIFPISFVRVICPL